MMYRRGASVLAFRHERTVGGTIGHGDFPNAVLQGSTANFHVYVDPSVGSAGPQIGQGVKLLADCLEQNGRGADAATLRRELDELRREMDDIKRRVQ